MNNDSLFHIYGYIFRDPLAFGRSDLDPFSPGGGMLFSPFGRQGRIQDLGGGVPGGIPR
jgi:hypothetical protein